MKPNTAKTLGEIGSMSTFSLSVMIFIYLGVKVFFVPDLLIAAAVIPSFVWAPLNLIASTPVLLGLRGLGDYYNDEGIKHNALRWFIWWAVAITSVSYAIVFPLLSQYIEIAIAYPLLLDRLVDISAISAIIIAFILAAAISIITSAIYLRRVYAALAARTGADAFDAAAKLYLLGSLLLIFGIGVFFVWASWLASCEAFSSMRLQRPDAAGTVP